MKKPYLNQYERECIRLGLASGDRYLLALKTERLKRDILKKLFGNNLNLKFVY